MAGELLPVTIEREPGKYYIYNCTNCIIVVDHEKSTWRNWGPKGEYRSLIKPAFIPERFGEECLFKISEDGAQRIYCLERFGDTNGSEFKALVERHKLTGLEFELVWTDQDA